MLYHASRTFCCLAAVLVFSAETRISLAAEPTSKPAETVDAPAKTVQQLLAEFHGNIERSIPVSQHRVDVINALRRAGKPLIDVLRADLAGNDAEVRTRALRVLLALGNHARPLLPEVIAAMGDDNPRVRAAAVPVLCYLRDPSGFNAIVQAAGDPDRDVRIAVIRHGRAALADAPFALAVLALKDRDLHVRVAALSELSLMKDKRAAGYLAPLLDDQTVLHYDVREGVKTARRVCDEAVQGLEYQINGVYLLPGKKTQEDYDALVQWWRQWWKTDGAKSEAAQYEEPELKRANM